MPDPSPDPLDATPPSVPPEPTPTSAPSLADLGWDDRWQSAADELTGPEPLTPARVVLQGQDVWRVAGGGPERTVRARGRLRHVVGLPVTGDWVLLRHDVVEHMLPRRAALRRKVAGARSQQQVIAANIDLVAVCTPANDVNLRRVERELTLVWESGATPVVVVTKRDLAGPDLEDTLRELATVAIGAAVVAVSARVGDGVAEVRELLTTGRTLAVMGPSGVGKSTLGNAFLGEQRLLTHAERADGKGRHTTTNRELVVLPGGGLLLDTPGMREVALWAGEDHGLDAAFADVEKLAGRCRFRDCEHDTEPGCAVTAAVGEGTLAPERLASWRKLQRELAHLARRDGARARSEQRQAHARLSRAMRGAYRP